VDKIQTLLDGYDSRTSTKRQWHAGAICAAKDLTRRIWQTPVDLEDDLGLTVSKHGSMNTAAKPAPADDKASMNQKKQTPKVRLFYGGLTRDSAMTWYDHLCKRGLPHDTRTPKPKPNREQQACIMKIIERCLQECEDESHDEPIRSEPVTALMHGVPGAGKSEVLYWIRDFFEAVCCWEHGHQFAYLASQNSMAALINGFTFHSYCALTWI
jgi:hypothetical protein